MDVSEEARQKTLLNNLLAKMDNLEIVEVAKDIDEMDYEDVKGMLLGCLLTVVFLKKNGLVVDAD